MDRGLVDTRGSKPNRPKTYRKRISKQINTSHSECFLLQSNRVKFSCVVRLPWRPHFMPTYFENKATPLLFRIIPDMNASGFEAFLPLGRSEGPKTDPTDIRRAGYRYPGLPRQSPHIPLSGVVTTLSFCSTKERSSS